MKAAFPPRLHAILARGSRVGVVFRRGPSKQVCSFLWDLDTDAFSLGQWLNGRIYERRADISPDGRLIIYFAMNGRWESETGGSWTAVSRTPWLKAISLYGKGDCWEGGGLFLSDNRYWLNDRYFSRRGILLESREVSRVEGYSPGTGFGSEDRSVYYPRLLRDGWAMIERRENAKWNSETIFDKPIDDRWTLRKIAHEQVGAPPGKGCYWDEHELRRADETALSFPAWEWADIDRGEIVWAEKGCLYRSSVTGDDGLSKPRSLHDFNSYKFTAIEAPY